MALDLDPGTAALGNPRLIQIILAEMRDGPIPFERFMELALYHPEFGYYRTPGRVGTSGDFLTSPAIHPMFGWSVAAWCHQVWQRAGSPADFTVFEPGAGDGRLASAVLDWAEAREPAFRAALRYVAIEPDATPPRSDPRIDWVQSPEPGEAGVVVANEFFDALPVRLFEASARGPVEVYVAFDAESGRFVETRGPVSLIDDAPIAGRFEVNQRAYTAMRQLCSLIDRGAVLLFDYGYPQDELWAPWRTGGTLLCFYRHTANEDPYAHVGEQDITAHVNLSELAAAAEDEGMDVEPPVSQGEFLLALGLGGLVEAARGDMEEYFARRRALQTLTDGAGLGRIRVLAAQRGLPANPRLPGFEERPA